MAKAKTSGKRKSSSKKSGEVILHPHKVFDADILDRETLKSILVGALIDGDIDSLKDVIVTQIRMRNKAEVVRKSKLGRQTLYDLVDGKREFNPTIKTLSQLLKAIA